MNPSKSRLLCWSRNKTHNLLSVPGVNSDEGGRGHQAQTPPPQQRNWLFFLTLHFLYFSVFDFQVVCWTRLCLIRFSIWNVFVPLPPPPIYCTAPCSRHVLWAQTAPGVRKSPDQASGLLKFILESTVQTSINKSRKINISAGKLEAWKKGFPESRRAATVGHKHGRHRFCQLFIGSLKCLFEMQRRHTLLYSLIRRLNNCISQQEVTTEPDQSFLKSF